MSKSETSKFLRLSEIVEKITAMENKLMSMLYRDIYIAIHIKPFTSRFSDVWTRVFVVADNKPRQAHLGSKRNGPTPKSFRCTTIQSRGSITT